MNRKRIYPDLRTWRFANRFSQRQAAQHLGMSQSAYSRLENQRIAPKPRVAKDISETAGVPLESILGIA